MTKLAMLIGAKPHENKIGPMVRLEAGSYMGKLDNVQDSVILLCSSQGAIGRIVEGIVFEKLPSDDYWTHITSVGKEKYINVSLEKVA